MPRPGPKPYECVRRAWHSDRHQPIRGSIIQQIFRVVHESHSCATKKNREWQEKLPIVVLRAEEIMYSKANTEAEYMDLETLWERVNDAINTIIRRDESTETGELLPPCVEAALNLGCVQVRASRSQRHNNPRTYLPPRAQEPSSGPPKVLESTPNEHKPYLLPLQTHVVSEPSRQVRQSNNPVASCNFPLPYEKTSSSGNTHFIPMESSTLLNVGSVYPLYYGTDFQVDRLPQPIFQTPKNLNTILVGMPIFPSAAESIEVGCSQNLLSNKFTQPEMRDSHRTLMPCDGEKHRSNRFTQPEMRDSHQNSSAPDCDLSLTLGPHSDHCEILGRPLARDNEHICTMSSQEGGKFGHVSPYRKEFSFFPMKSTDDSSSKWNPESEDQGAEAAFRKRKTPYSNNVEDERFSWVPGHTLNLFPGRMKRPGS